MSPRLHGWSRPGRAPAIAAALLAACSAVATDDPDRGRSGKADSVGSDADTVDATVTLDGGFDAEPSLDAAGFDAAAPVPFDQRAFPPADLLALAGGPCVPYSAQHRVECAAAMYDRFWTAWVDRHGTEPTFGDVLTAVYRGELFTVHGWGASVADVALEGFARFFWRAIGAPEINADRLLVFLGAMHAWYIYGPDFMPIRDVYLSPEPGLRDQVKTAVIDSDYALGAAPARPVDWANWGQGKPGFSDFSDGMVEGQDVPLVIRYCSQAGGYDYYFAILAPGQANSALRPPSTAGDPIPGDPTCGVYVHRCPACN